MSEAERYDVVVVGSGEGGKYLAWHMAQSGHTTAVVERRWVGGSCPEHQLPPEQERNLERGGRPARRITLQTSAP